MGYRKLFFGKRWVAPHRMRTPDSRCSLRPKSNRVPHWQEQVHKAPSCPRCQRESYDGCRCRETAVNRQSWAMDSDRIARQTISPTPEMNNRPRMTFRTVASSIRPKRFRPSQVPAMTHGSPAKNSQIVPLVTAPFPPSQSALIRNVATATGWKTDRWTSLDHPRSPHQIVTRIPARPVRPPRTPLRYPTAASTTGPSAATDWSDGRKNA